MAEKSLVNALLSMFHNMEEDTGVKIDGAALMPAFDGMVAGLYILTVSMPDGKVCADKIECLIRAMHNYIDVADRKSIAAVRVFDSKAEFDSFVKYGYNEDACDVCEQSMAVKRVSLKPEELVLA